MDRRKILMILSNPFIVDPRVYKEAKSLSEAGYEVTVIVWDRHREYEEETTIEGVKVVRIRNRGIMKILPHDLFREFFWWRAAYKKAMELYKSGYKFEIVHCHDLDTLPAGVWSKKKLGIKLIYDAHEIFGYMIARDMPKIVVKAAFWLERHLIRYVDHVIVAEETYKSYFDSLVNKQIPITTLLNCKDLVTNKYIPPKNDVFTIIYIGVLNRSRFFPEALEVIGGINDVKFIIAGKKENMYEEIKELSKRYNNVEFLGTIPYNKVIPYTLKSDAVLCMINPKDINNKIASANKQFEAMVCGRPIIATKGTRSGEITEKEKCGLVINYSKEDLRKAIITLRDNPKLCEELGKNALKAAIEKYNWENEKKKLIRIYESLTD
ncbi:MAG: hypothetical protein DRN18_00290 [Thermoplasmata archaeon]|nr:MAG: hypothetical protein DRN18_00290 [Thermoplasmata archaeon]